MIDEMIDKKIEAKLSELQKTIDDLLQKVSRLEQSDNLLSVQGAADLLHVKAPSLTKRIRKGRLKAQKIGGKYYINPQNLAL